MKYINIYIVDYSINDTSSLNKILQLFVPVIKVVGIQNNYEINIEFLVLKKIDILFINIDFLKNLNTQNIERIIKYNIQIVVIIDNEKKAPIAFKYNAIYCIKKPFLIEDISLAVNKIFIYKHLNK